MLVSVVTPIFNRAGLIGILYDSLLRQNLKNFEWIIIDDGSTDNLKEIINNFSTSSFPIKYIYKDNGGKHTALNLGIELATGEWVFVVDSDDYLADDAMYTIKNKTENLHDEIDGLIFLKVSPESNTVGSLIKNDKTKMHSKDLAAMKGDKAYVVKSNVIKKYKFPEHAGEKFATESLLWNKIFDKGNGYALGFNEAIYVCEYLPGGLTDNYFNLLKNNQKGTIEFVLSNLNLREISLSLCKQAAYHFVPIMNLRNLMIVFKNTKKMNFVKFFSVLILMRIKLSMVKK